MSDLGRPALPDPQQDRHVAFPERTPEAADTAADGAAAGTGGGASAAGPPGLPADAWADHSSPTGAGPSSTWQPDPVVLRTPPTRPEARSRRRRPAWLPYAAIVGIFLVVSNGNNHDDVTVQRDGTFSSGQEQGGPPDPWGNPPPDPAQVGWISSAGDPGTVKAPIGADTPVSRVPAGTIVLRVEVTAPSPEDVITQVSTEAGLYEETPESTPVLREVHTGPASRSLDVTVSSATGSSMALQCRIYAGETLVALDTSTTGRVACTVTW